MSSMPKAWARCATREPARPRPTTPSTLPCSSTPSHFERSHRPALSAASAWGMLRACANISAIACSATDRMFDVGALTTMTPRSVAAFTSTLSSPTPARPTTWSDVPAARTSAVTCVAERMISACAPTIASSSSVGLSPSRTSTSWPASASRSSPLCAIFSVTSTRATAVVLLAPPASCGAAVCPDRPDRPDCSVLRLGEQRSQPGDALNHVVVRHGVGHAEEAGRTERLPGYDRHLGLVDAQLCQLRAARRTLSPEGTPEQALDRRERVERAFGLGADHAVDLVEHLDDGATPDVERLSHRCHVLEAARHC